MGGAVRETTRWWLGFLAAVLREDASTLSILSFAPLVLPESPTTNAPLRTSPTSVLSCSSFPRSITQPASFALLCFSFVSSSAFACEPSLSLFTLSRAVVARLGGDWGEKKRLNMRDLTSERVSLRGGRGKKVETRRVGLEPSALPLFLLSPCPCP